MIHCFLGSTIAVCDVVVMSGDAACSAPHRVAVSEPREGRYDSMPGYGAKSFTAFGGLSIFEFKERYNRAIVEEVRKLTDAEIFGEEDDLLASLTTRFHLDVPVIDLDNRSHNFVSTDSGSPVIPNRYATQPLRYVEYKIPTSGDIDLLTVRPQSTQMIGFNILPEVFAKQGSIVFYIPDHGGNPQEMANRAKEILDCLLKNSTQLRLELEAFGGSIPGSVRQAVSSEKLRRERSVSATKTCIPCCRNSFADKTVYLNAREEAPTWPTHCLSLSATVMRIMHSARHW